MSQPSTMPPPRAARPDVAILALWGAVSLADALLLVVVLPVPVVLLLAPALVRVDRIDLGVWLIDTPVEGWLAALPGLLLSCTVAVLAIKLLPEQIAWVARATAPSREYAAQVGAARGISELSEREMQVLRLMSLGYTNGAIAKELFISEATVRKHVGRIFAKLDVNRMARDRRVTAVLAYVNSVGRSAQADPEPSPPAGFQNPVAGPGFHDWRRAGYPSCSTPCPRPGGCKL